MSTESATPPLDELLAHREWARRFARSLVRDESAADDLAQEAWLAAVEHPPRHTTSPTGWLRRVLVTRSINRARSARRREAHEIALARADSAPATDDVVALAESHRLVVEAVLALDEPYRTTVLLRFFEDLTPREVAQRMETSVDNVYSRLRRGAARLRERLDAEHGGERRRSALLLLAGPMGVSGGDALPTTAGAAVGGGVLTATSTKWIAAATLLLLLGAWATWQALHASDDSRRSTEKAEVAGHGAGQSTKADRHAVREADVAASQSAPAAPLPFDPDAVAFSGRVVGPNSQPIAGASVIALPTRPTAELGAPPHVARTVSSADGAFGARLPKGTATADVSASAPGFAVAAVERVRLGAPVQIRLVREGVVLGRVLDPKGAPIRGAVVRAFRVVGREHIDEVRVTTGDDGAYRVGGWAGSMGPDAPMKRPFLDVRASGYGGTQVEEIFPDPGQELRLDVVLFPSRPMDVLVADADSGAPIEGASVSVGLASTPLQITQARDGGYVLPHPAPYLVEGTSDVRGVCTLQDAPARLPMLSHLVVRAWRKGFAPAFAKVQFRPATDDERVELRLWPSATVTGRVVDADGKPFACSVTSFPNDGSGGQWFPVPIGDLPWCGWVTTDVDGRYVLPCVPATAAGTRNVAVWTWGDHGHAGVDVLPRSGETLAAPDIVMPVKKPLRAAGFTVVGPDGAPVADAFVASPGARDGTVRTDAEGHAVLHWPAQQMMGYTFVAEPTVDVYARGFARTMVKCRPDVATAPETRVELQPGLRLTGRVVEQDGRPVVRAHLHAENADVAGWWPVDATTDADGSFVIEDLPGRPFDVFVSSKGNWAPDRAEARHAEFHGATPGGAPIAIQLPPDVTKRGTLIASVVDEDGGPVVEAAVSVESEPRTNATSSTSTPGVMTLSVAAGTWAVKATARGRISASESATIVDGQTTRLTLVTARGTPVTVRVVRPAALKGTPDSMWASRVDVGPGERGAGADSYSHEWSADRERVQFDALPPGRYVLHYETPAWGRAPETFVSVAPIEVGPPGKSTARATAELVVGGFVGVKIDDPEAAEPSKADPSTLPGAIEVLAPGGERRRVLRGAVRGPARTIGLPPGDYAVRLHLPSGRVRETTATVRAGETTEVAFGAR